MEKSNNTPQELVTQFFESVWHSPHDLDAIDNFMTEDYRITTAGSLISGRENFKNWVKGFQQLLLDAKTESIDLIFDPSQSKVVSRWVCTGRNNGLFALKPDYKFVSFTGIAIWTIRDNKLAECWVERSAYELFQQLKENSQNQFV
ncbi:SnoaL-like polyketide cyclase [Arenibacter palladensis]|uniref:SnoaL-like polyketide cyclase n=1 Tax=Arenibacter palladensis TaxID=237373 RepID=A0A1M4XXR8_9FLAO|nr:ester cyclase [Arenibacter palladensis]SHE98042.1 SnoaL-like polyketide cyclase [Arenibacter palladensis]